MNNIYKNNLVESCLRRLLICSIAIIIATVICVSSISANKTKIKKAQENAFIFNKNGASIHVYKKQMKK